MDEQIAQLCTLQVSQSAYTLRLRQTQESIATWLGNRLTISHADSSHVTTFGVTTELLNGPLSWVRLLKSPTFRVRALLDPKCPVVQIHFIRIQVHLNSLSQNWRALTTLLDEDLLETCIAQQPCFVENLDQHQDRTIRKQQRIASERLKDQHQTMDLSDQTAELASILMRYRERLDESEQWTPSSLSQSSLGLGFFYNWQSKSFQKSSSTCSPKGLAQLKVYADSFSQTERSILCAWKAATKDILITGPETKTFFLPQTMYISVDNDAYLEQWISECKALDVSQCILENGFLPSSFQNVDVVFVRPNVLPTILSARTQVCQTLSFTLRMQHDGGFRHSILSTNDERSRKLQMSTIQKWTHNMESLADLPIAWTTPGCYLVDDRAHEGPSTSVHDFLGPPQVILRTGLQDIEPEDAQSLIKPRIAQTLHLGYPRKWLKNVRLKMCHVSPDITDVRLQQWTSLHHNPVSAEDIVRQMGPQRMTLRATLPHQLSLDQAKDLVAKHFEILPTSTLADHSLGRNGSLQTRSLSESNLSCQVCFDSIDPSKGFWWTLCSHSFCADCGPMAFRAWSPHHNAGSTFVACPMCRTNVSSLDVFRCKTDIGPQVPLDNISQAVALETSSLGRRHDPPERPLFVHIQTKHDYSDDFFDRLPSTVHTLLFSHIEASLVPRWAPKILQWIATHKKNIRIVFVSGTQCQATTAFRKYFENP